MKKSFTPDPYGWDKKLYIETMNDAIRRAARKEIVYVITYNSYINKVCHYIRHQQSEYIRSRIHIQRDQERWKIDIAKVDNYFAYETPEGEVVSSTSFINNLSLVIKEIAPEEIWSILFDYETKPRDMLAIPEKEFKKIGDKTNVFLFASKEVIEKYNLEQYLEKALSILKGEKMIEDFKINKTNERSKNESELHSDTKKT